MTRSHSARFRLRRAVPGLVGLLLAFCSQAQPLKLAMLSPPERSAAGAGFGVRWGAERSTLPINPLMAQAGQAVTLQVDGASAAGFTLDAGGGAVQRLAPGQWRWTAPGKPGAYTLEIRRADGASMRFTALVAVSRQALRGGLLNGYLIGDYPSHPDGQATVPAARGLHRSQRAHRRSAVDAAFAARAVRVQAGRARIALRRRCASGCRWHSRRRSSALPAPASPAVA